MSTQISSAEREVIRDLIALARITHQALDDSEEFEGDDGRAHAIAAQAFDDMDEALDRLDALPDDRPGYTLGPAGKAEWALRHILEEVPAGQTTSCCAETLWKRDDNHTFMVLQLVGGQDVPRAAIDSWSDSECLAAEEWALATHLNASDNDDVDVPPMPACVQAFATRTGRGAP